MARDAIVFAAAAIGLAGCGPARAIGRELGNYEYFRVPGSLRWSEAYAYAPPSLADLVAWSDAIVYGMIVSSTPAPWIPIESPTARTVVRVERVYLGDGRIEAGQDVAYIEQAGLDEGELHDGDMCGDGKVRLSEVGRSYLLALIYDPVPATKFSEGHDYALGGITMNRLDIDGRSVRDTRCGALPIKFAPREPEEFLSELERAITARRTTPTMEPVTTPEDGRESLAPGKWTRS